MTRTGGLVFSGLALLLLACRAPLGPERLRPVAGEEARMRAWVERARGEARERVRIRAVSRLRLDSPRGSGRVREVILAERPARLRLESLNFLGQTATLLVTDGERFSFFDGEALEHGTVTPGVLRDAFGLDLHPAEAVDLLLAAPPLPEGLPLAVFGRGLDRVVDFDSERLRFGESGDLRAIEVLDPAGGVRWQAEYDRWRDVPGGRYPLAMVLYFPVSDLRAEFEFQDVEVNPSIDPTLFRLPPDRRE